MPVDPGRTDGGRPRIGEQVSITLDDDTLETVDAVQDELRKLYVRVPRRLRSRSAILRYCIQTGLKVLRIELDEAWKRRKPGSSG